MKDISSTQPITVTLQTWEWFWLLGLLAAVKEKEQNSILEKLQDQIFNAVG